MKRLLAMLGTGIVAGTVSAEEVNWHAAVPLWKRLATDGKVVEAGPAPSWLTAKPGDPIARLGLPTRVEPAVLPLPRELPEAVIVIKGPILPLAEVSPKAVPSPSTYRPTPYGRVSFASGRVNPNAVLKK